jgi:hypothetical protein
MLETMNILNSQDPADRNAQSVVFTSPALRAAIEEIAIAHKAISYGNRVQRIAAVARLEELRVIFPGALKPETWSRITSEQYFLHAQDERSEANRKTGQSKIRQLVPVIRGSTIALI